MVILGVIAAVVAIAVPVAVFSLQKSPSPEVDSELKVEGKQDEAGIYYGGTFDEFQYITEEEMESSETERASELLDDQGTVLDEDKEETMTYDETETDLDKIKEDFEREKSRIIPKETVKGKINISQTDKSEPEVGDIIEGLANEENSEDDTVSEGEVYHMDVPVFHSNGYAEHEVICDAESQEEAEQIASRISGTLLSWQNNVAKIQIEGSVDELLEQLEQQGSDLMLYRNYNM